MKLGRFSNSYLFGREQESRAAAFLRAQGLRFICSNYRSRYGEIDLIMSDASTLVFIEVRFRRNSNYGSPVDTVNAQKQRKIRLTATQYLQSHVEFQHLVCRFDVVGLSEELGQRKPRVNWIKNAFS